MKDNLIKVKISQIVNLLQTWLNFITWIHTLLTVLTVTRSSKSLWNWSVLRIQIHFTNYKMTTRLMNRLTTRLRATTQGRPDYSRVHYHRVSPLGASPSELWGASRRGWR